MSWLHIRSLGGEYILRMEDIDRDRCKPAYADAILEDLRWLGLDWDEGPDIGGPYGPYVQSSRLELYHEAMDTLLRRGHLYPCYCSRHDILAAAGAPHGLSSEGPVYPGTCRTLLPEEAAAKAKRKQPSLRFRVPERTIAFKDEAAGRQEYPASAGGDFIVRRADGIFSYQLAVVVDDALMGITHVLRGSDLLDSTPRQLLLYEALGYAPPSFGHLPLLMGEDGRRLAKRHGGISLSELRGIGVSPGTAAGWLAWVGGLIPEPSEMTPQELIPRFDLGRIPERSIVVTPGMLNRLIP